MKKFGLYSAHRLALLMLISCLCALTSRAQTACATVSIAIEQEVTLERQAFEATLTVGNGLAQSLEDFTVVVWIKSGESQQYLDRQPNTRSNTSDLEFFKAAGVSTDLFFFKPIESEAPVDIAASADKVFTYRLIPTQDAALLPAGSRYEVGADITYKLGGKEESISVEPDSILVKPLPSLTIEYFLPKSVIADNPNTLFVEPVQPFHLGMRIVNSGVGDAKNLKIESFQPIIEENNQGLLVEFEILGASVNGGTRQPSLVADFGTLSAGQAESAVWEMVSSLYGRFIQARASFTHSDELGGEVTSVLDETTVYRLVGMVQANADTIPDFLSIGAGSAGETFASDDFKMSLIGGGSTVQDLLRLHPSGLQGDGSPDIVDYAYVANLSNYVDEENVLLSGNKLTIPVENAPSSAAGVNYSFLRVLDPNNGRYELGSVRRESDGKLLKRDNFYLVKELAENADGTINESAPPEAYIDIFDIGNISGTSYANAYEVTYGALISNNTPPTIGSFPEIPTVRVGELIEFSFEVNDLDGDSFQLAAIAIPETATLSEDSSTLADVSTALYNFSWTAEEGLSPFSVQVSDGQDVATATISINVIAATQDGVEDWLSKYSLDAFELDTDLDLDGYSNLLEFVLNLDPTDPASQTLPRIELVEVSGQKYLSLVCDILAELNPLSGTPGVSVYASTADSIDLAAVWTPISNDPIQITSGFSSDNLAPAPGMVRLRWVDPVPLSDSFSPRYLRLEAQYDYDDTPPAP